MIKKTTALLCSLILLAVSAACIGQASAQSPDAPVTPPPEDFEGEYTGKYISFGENMIPLAEDEYYTLTIKGDEAVISEGIVTGTKGPGTMTIKLIYENGELYWQPDDADVKVFVLRMLEDGSVTITFEINPEIPVFHFEPADPVK